jgi:hypothetical protein
MTDIVLVKQNRVPISEADKEVVRRVLFGVIDGLSPEHKKAWRRMWNWFLTKAEPGEMLELQTHRERLSWYHKKHMALEQAVFQSQERFVIFDAFRDWLKVGSGHVDWCAGPRGGVFPRPKSISYAKLEQDEMEKFHNAAVEFLRSDHAQKYLWKHLPPLQRDAAMNLLLSGFHE